ncbi:MAG: sensor histidine kinase [Blautia sp.]
MKESRIGLCLSRHFKSIQSTIFTAVAILVLSAVLIVTAVSVKYTDSAIFENSVLYTQTITKQINQNIDSYITYMDNIVSVISGSEDAQYYLFRESSDRGHEKRLLEQFRIILKGRSDIKNIGLVCDEGNSLFNTGYQTENPDLDLSTQEWYKKAVESRGESILTSSHVQHVIEGERPWVITMSRGIANLVGSRASKGAVFIDLNYSAISELCDQNSIGDKGYVFIVDQDGNIVYHPQQQQLYNELQTENIDAVMNAKTDTVTVGKGEHEKIYTISRSEKTGWTVVGCMNVAELLKGSRQAQRVYVVCAAGLIVLALILSRLLARNITYPIQRLRDSMKKVQTGEFPTIDLEVSSENEIGSLTKSFNVMTHRIQELMAQNIHEQEQKRKSELKALQSQINPHFLYNTLDSIIWMAEGKKNEEVVLMTASLARLLRQSISNEDELVSIGQEAEYARSYLTIQKMRYKDKLEFQIDISPAIFGVKIIKLVLQPIIENAIYHGLKYKDSKGFLIVRGYREGEKAVLEVEDNGVGMDEETLSHIFEKHKVNYHSNGVGVYNVQKRLKLYYGEEYGIVYKSRKNEGTRAVITIPVETGGKL